MAKDGRKEAEEEKKENQEIHKYNRWENKDGGKWAIKEGKRKGNKAGR